MQADFDTFVDRMIHKYEGGYCWDKGDAGGPTNFGITCYDLAEERHKTMNSMAAWAPIVKAMPESEALTIYGTKYKGDFDLLPAGPDCAEFDYKVNSGIGRVAKVRPQLLKLAGKTSVQACDPAWYVDAICQERLHFLKGLSNWSRFGGGWGARVSDLKAYCDHIASGLTPANAPPVKPTVTPVPKGAHPPVDPGHVTGTVLGTGGAAGTAVSQGLHWAPALALGVIGVGAIIGWAAWKQHQIAALNATVVLPPTIPPHP